jgi:cytochrome c556
MKTKLKILLTTLSCSVVLWGATSYAHTAHFEQPTRSAELSNDFRNATMSIYKWYLSPMGAMVKGKTDFNAKVFADYAEGLKRVSTLSLMEGFPKESGEDHVDDSDAKEEIWKNMADFNKKFKAFQTEANKLATIAKAGNEAAIKAQFKKTAGTCGTCHKRYRAK